MNPIEMLSAEGPALLLGSTAVLFLGALAVSCTRVPIHRQRLAELSVAAALLFVIAALPPLPRFSFTASEAIEVREVVPVVSRSTPAVSPAVTLPDQVVFKAALPVVSSGHRAIGTTGTPDPIESTDPILRVSAAPSTQVDLPRRIVGVYLLGSAIFVLGLLLGAVRLLLILRRRVPLPAWIRSRVERLHAQGRGRASVLVTRARCRPFCFGVLKPRIVLPAHLCTSDLAEQLDSILEHEFSHIRQKDGVGQMMFALALPLFYFHPLFWWLRNRARLAAEMIADDRAARSTGREVYARRLIDLSALDRGGFSSPLGATSLFASKSTFSRRIEMLIKRRNPLERRCSPFRRNFQIAAAATVLVLFANLFGARPVAVAQEDSGSSRVKQLLVERDRLETDLQTLRDQVRLLQQELTKQRASSAVIDPRLPVDRGPGVEVVVQKGDTLEGIVLDRTQASVDLAEVMRWNPGIDPARLKPGQRIRLPYVPPEVQAEPAKPLEPTVPAHRSASLGKRLTAMDDAPILGSASLALVTQLIDLMGDLEVALGTFADRKALHSQGAITDAELLATQIRFETTQKKCDLFRRLFEAELESAERSLATCSQELGRAVQLSKEGYVHEQEVRAAEDRLIRQQARVSVLRECFEPVRKQSNLKERKQHNQGDR